MAARAPGQAIPLGNVASLRRTVVPAVVSHVNTELTFDVYANVQDRDLGGVAKDIRRAIASFEP
jgi:Cu/Ag efflux pump CusA